MQIETRKVYDTLVVEMSGRLDSRTAGTPEIAWWQSPREPTVASC